MEVDRIDAAILELDKNRELTYTRVAVEVDQIDAAVRHRGISHDGTYRQAVEVDRIDAGVLAEELA